MVLLWFSWHQGPSCADLTVYIARSTTTKSGERFEVRPKSLRLPKGDIPKKPKIVNTLASISCPRTVDVVVTGRRQLIQDEKKSFQEKETLPQWVRDLFIVMNQAALTCGYSSKSRLPQQRRLPYRPRVQIESHVYYYVACECSYEGQCAQRRSPCFGAQ